MSDIPPAATQVVQVAAPAPPRWIPIVTVLIGIFGVASVIIGGLLTYGGWRAGVDGKMAELDKRITRVEAGDIPVLVRMSKDIEFLVARAKREDDRSDRRR